MVGGHFSQAPTIRYEFGVINSFYGHLFLKVLHTNQKLKTVKWSTMLTLSLLTVPSLKLLNFPNYRLGKIDSKVLLNRFPMNGHTLGLCPYNQQLENFVSPKVSHKE